MIRPPATFAMRASAWTRLFVWPLIWRRPVVEVRERDVAVRMGWIGGAEIPFEAIDRLGRMAWPWWGGIGVRIGKGLVAFMPSSGPAAVLELSEPMRVRAPLGWRTARVVVGVADVDGFIDAVVEARRVLRAQGAEPEEP